MYNSKNEAGLSISYPSISIHAVQNLGSPTDEPRKLAVWMQIDLDDSNLETAELTLIPKPDEAGTNHTQELYAAIANCSYLYPNEGGEDEEDEDVYNASFDADEDGAEPQLQTLEGFTGVMRGAADGSLPPPMPGSGGWITAENVHEHFDSNGNWIGQKEEEEEGDEQVEGNVIVGLAGRVRSHSKVDDHGDLAQDEAKRRKAD